MSKSTFAIKPDKLVELTKEILASGMGTGDEYKYLADDFEFCAPVVGPIGKQEYADAIDGFDLLKAFPDTEGQYHFIRVDPFENDRVWWHSRTVATHQESLLGEKPTGKQLVLPPQANSFKFNEDGKVVEMTIGYVLDRRQGNTGGLGGAFAFLYGIGRPLPFRECQPYKPSKRLRFFNFIGSVARRMRKNKE